MYMVQCIHFYRSAGDRALSSGVYMCGERNEWEWENGQIQGEYSKKTRVKRRRHIKAVPPAKSNLQGQRPLTPLYCNYHIWTHLSLTWELYSRMIKNLTQGVNNTHFPGNLLYKSKDNVGVLKVSVGSVLTSSKWMHTNNTRLWFIGWYISLPLILSIYKSSWLMIVLPPQSRY